MTTPAPTRSRAAAIHRWIRYGFLIWACLSLSWLANSVRTRGVAEELLASDGEVTVVDGPTSLELHPREARSDTALLFFCGSGIHPHAYAPLLRPIADAGCPVFVVKLPYRLAPLASHKEEALGRARRLTAAHPEIVRWVIAGHSLGGALAARLARTERGLDADFVLIGTTHPREADLSGLGAPFTKVYATNDGIAPVDRVLDSAKRLPEATRWVAIEGGNHSQFGHYGRQLFDGEATISREAQQALTREVLLDALREGGE